MPVIRPQLGSPEPLGVGWDGAGVNIAVWSAHASAVDFCLFDSPDADSETARVRLPSRTGEVWHGFLSDVGPGQLYGFRVHGPVDPQAGQLFNPQKLLLDPYAKALCGQLKWHESLASRGLPPAWTSAQAEACGSPSPEDTARFVPKGVIIDSSFNWEGDERPGTAWRDTVIYECHVKGLTVLHPDVPPHERGRYLGLASEPIVDHVKKLGITAIELLPVYHSVDEWPLIKQGLVNYWGYNPLALFAPHSRYASGDAGQQVTEFREMVKRLHRAGIEVILDVVYNHTAESDHTGPTLSLKGLGNAEYYRLQENDRRLYENFSGCGNTLNFAHPIVRRLTMDSLRYWVEEMHVDGFRFDLATVLARGRDGRPEFDGFVRRIAEDPVLHEVKLISEPWDVGPDGYALGRFPHGWSEWNDVYRRTVRRFWRGDALPLGQLAHRLAGSSDVFGASGRGACASINYVASHDGFILRDLVTYEKKRNEANGQDNRDGPDDNDSRNWGCEGETDDTEILRIRRRMQRNFLATLFLSRGVPMIVAGDEIHHTNQGNNNAYCQDNEVSWINWKLDRDRRRLLGFTQTISALRRSFRNFSSCEFYRGEVICGCGLKDVTWVRPDGAEMALADWEDSSRHTLGMLLHGHGDGETDGPAEGVTVMVVLHGGEDRVSFSLPKLTFPGRWTRRIDTAVSNAARREPRPPGDTLDVRPRTVLVCEYRQT